jgi:uncharacterized RDD family membrane protein YckC
MNVDLKRVVAENEFLFDYLKAEKEKYYKKAVSNKLSVFLIGSLMFIGRAIPEFIDSPVVLIIVSLGTITVIGLPLLLMSNETILTSKAIRTFYNTYKIQVAGSILKLISEKLQFKPQNRVLNNVIVQSAMFGNKITEVRGKNLITGKFGNSEIQMSELVLLKGMNSLFEGLFVYVSGADESRIDYHAIEKLNGKWNIKDNNLYMTFSGIRKLFEVRVEKSGRTIENLRNQAGFIAEVLQIAGNAASVTFTSEYKVPDLQSDSEDLLKQYNTFTHPVTRETYKLAPSLKRFLNVFIDQFIITALWMIPVFILSLIFKFSPAKEWVIIATYPVAVFLYYIIAESSYSRTIGKAITKTRVITDTGEKPGLPAIIKRTLCRFIPFEQFSFIQSDIGLHDRFSRTIVVIDRE